jgi:hypothetical protein
MSIIFQVSTNVTSSKHKIECINFLVGDRIGIQATFANSGDIPDVFNEVRFAPIGFDSFYALQQIITTYDSGAPPPSVFFQTTASSTNLPITLDSVNQGINLIDDFLFFRDCWCFICISIP